jgi:hypothetical protein
MKQTTKLRSRAFVLSCGSLLALTLCVASVWAQGNPYQEPVITRPQAVSQNDTAPVVATGLESLTPEERNLLDLGLLPPYYPRLRDCYEGRSEFASGPKGLEAAKNLMKSFYPKGKGNFTQHFGNPQKMLSWAKAFAKDPAMVKLVTSARRGDIILTGPQSKKSQSGDFVCLMTKGPYHHAILVVDGPPPVFIEAVGVTGQWGDPMGDRVRYNTWYEQFGSWNGLKLLRPTHGMAGGRAQDMIEKAVAFAENQLGKPYDYAFTDADNNKAFYCSELVYKAFREGAGYQDFLKDKTPERDRMLIAMHAVIDGLEPKDKFALSDKLIRFTMDFTSTKPPDMKKLQAFIVNELVPGCRVFEKAFPTVTERAKLNGVLDKILADKAFPSYAAAQKTYAQEKAAGKYEAGWGLGKLREIRREAGIGLGLVADVNRLAKESGAKKGQLAWMMSKLIVPVYKNLGTYGDFMTGMNRDAGLPLSSGVQTMLGIVDWGVKKRDQVKKWPVVGEFFAGFMPGNGDGKIKTDFTSPTDLAEASPGFVVNYP